MARSSSKGSGSRKSRTKAEEGVPAEANEDSVAAEGAADETPNEGELGGDTVLVGDTALGEDSVAPEPEVGDRVTIKPGDTTAAEPVTSDDGQTEIVEDTPSTDAKEAPAAPVVERKGPGAGSLIFGGAVAAALGFGAAYLGFGQDAPSVEPDPALTTALERIEAQSATIAELEQQLAALAAVEPPSVPEVDLSGLEGTIDAVQGSVTSLAGTVTGVGENVSGIDSALTALTGRVAALEDRPVFTGELDEDNAAMAAAVEALEARLNAERDEAAAAVAAAQEAQAATTAEMQAASEAAQAAIAEAEARAAETAAENAAAMAAAEAQAAETVAATQAQAALSRIQIAMAAGNPFADALADLPMEAPVALAAVADEGVPTDEDLQAAFPAAARAALPIALREVAGDSAADRLGAFLMGQIGGRSTEPRDGDGPDAVLSRAEAAVAVGDIDSALAEIDALPEGAQAALQNWIMQAETRAAADAALAELAASLDN